MSKIEIKVPTVGESVTEVTLSSWLVEDGDYVKLDQPLAEFESDKATFEMPSEVAGVITRVAKEGDDIKIGGLVAYIDTDAAAPEKSAVVSPQSTVDSPQKKEEVKDLKKEVKATLLNHLKQWRLEKAKAESVPPYVIFNDNTLAALSKEKIVALSDLEGITGIGQVKLKKYGAEVLEIIKEFNTEEKPKKSATVDETIRLYNEGNSVEEIAALRGFSLSTITEHIIKSYKEGKISTIDNLIDNDSYLIIINTAKEIETFDRLRPIFDHLNEKYSFEEIKFALAKFEVESQNGNR